MRNPFGEQNFLGDPQCQHKCVEKIPVPTSNILSSAHKTDFITLL